MPLVSSSNLSFRHTANKLFDDINKIETKNIIIDFCDIQTISRSFAHQFLIRKKETKKKITEINMNEDVKKMFKVVASTKPHNHKKR